MKLIVRRLSEHQGSTIGEMTLDGEHLCYTLEDGYHDEKIAGETRIPAGTYKLKLRDYGGFHSRYKAAAWLKNAGVDHIGMLEVCDVPGFTDILIHTGNTKLHTQGCTLVGTSYTEQADGYFLSSSRKAYTQIYPDIANALADGVDVTIEYLDNDR